MNFREVKEANKLIDEITMLDSLTMDAQNSARTLTISTQFNGVTLRKEHKTKVMQVLFGMRRELAEELEKLGVTEDYNND